MFIVRVSAMLITQQHITTIVSMAKAYGATRLILFGSFLEAPEKAKDIDLACDGVKGWKLYELAARLEEELQTPLDIIPLSPPTRFTRLIESKGKVLI
jgi:predicted nucleotidyltransferase